MDQLATLEYSVRELQSVVANLDDTQMDTVTNCEPWTVRRLASHALNNQLLWAGLVTGQELVSVEDTMGAAPIAGDLAPVADDVADRAMGLWRSDGVLEAMHSAPFGELPGSAGVDFGTGGREAMDSTPVGEVPGSGVVNFATVDAMAHAWDLSASVGDAIEFRPDA